MAKRTRADGTEEEGGLSFFEKMNGWFTSIGDFFSNLFSFAITAAFVAIGGYFLFRLVDGNKEWIGNFLERNFGAVAKDMFYSGLDEVRGAIKNLPGTLRDMMPASIVNRMATVSDTDPAKTAEQLANIRKSIEEKTGSPQIAQLLTSNKDIWNSLVAIADKNSVKVTEFWKSGAALHELVTTPALQPLAKKLLAEFAQPLPSSASADAQKNAATVKNELRAALASLDATKLAAVINPLITDAGSRGAVLGIMSDAVKAANINVTPATALNDFVVKVGQAGNLNGSITPAFAEAARVMLNDSASTDEKIKALLKMGEARGAAAPTYEFINTLSSTDPTLRASLDTFKQSGVPDLVNALGTDKAFALIAPEVAGKDASLLGVPLHFSIGSYEFSMKNQPVHTLQDKQKILADIVAGKPSVSDPSKSQLEVILGSDILRPKVLPTIASLIPGVTFKDTAPLDNLITTVGVPAVGAALKTLTSTDPKADKSAALLNLLTAADADTLAPLLESMKIDPVKADKTLQTVLSLVREDKDGKPEGPVIKENVQAILNFTKGLRTINPNALQKLLIALPNEDAVNAVLKEYPQISPHLKTFADALKTENLPEGIKSMVLPLQNTSQAVLDANALLVASGIDLTKIRNSFRNAQSTVGAMNVAEELMADATIRAKLQDPKIQAALAAVLNGKKGDICTLTPNATPNADCGNTIDFVVPNLGPIVTFANKFPPSDPVVKGLIAIIKGDKEGIKTNPLTGEALTNFMKNLENRKAFKTLLGSLKLDHLSPEQQKFVTELNNNFLVEEVGQKPHGIAIALSDEEMANLAITALTKAFEKTDPSKPSGRSIDPVAFIELYQKGTSATDPELARSIGDLIPVVKAAKELHR